MPLRVNATPRRLAYTLCVLALLPSLSFAAYLLSQTHTRELALLHQSAQSRAALAASFFDEQMGSLLGSLKELAGTPATASENIHDHLRSQLDQNGIVVFTRGANLDLLSPASGANAAIVSLDASARSAAAAALATLAPQITPYGAAKDGGITIWIASSEKDAAPILLEARIPSSYLASVFKNFTADGPWSIAVLGSNGQTYAQAYGKSHGAADTFDFSGNSKASLIQAMAETSQFGWKISAELPDRTLELHTRRNWMTFVAISSLLAIASFSGATLLTRNLLEEPPWNNLTQASEMPSSIDRHREAQAFITPVDQDEDRLRSALQAGHVGVWEWDLKSGLVHWDSEIAQILDGASAGNSRRAQDLLRHVDPHDRRRLLNAVRTATAKSSPLAIEIRLYRPNQEARWIAVRGAAIKTKSGQPSGLSGVAYDVTDQKLNLTRTDALLREVSHRSKNLLALILAMARLTARDAVDVKSHLKDFTLRVAGLAASQDLIVASDWQSVDLATLASAEIGAVARTDADRIRVSGPPVSLTPEAAQTFGMVLTELALNAVEHGALSSATGDVSLSWSFPKSDTIMICWHETGGPPFHFDAPKGYGKSVVERFSAQGLKLSVRATAEDDGVKWTLSGPLANIGARTERRA